MILKILVLCVYIAAYIGRTAASAPYFTIPGFKTVAEDMEIGTVICTFNVTDDGSITLSYAPSELLSLSPTNGTSFLTVNVTLKSMFDRETSDRHTVRIVAKDNDQNEVLKTMEIYVDDVNDNAPSFDNTPYFWDIPELPYLPATYDYIHATDPDRGSNAKVNYSFKPKTQSNATAEEYLDTFKIDENTGQITLKKQLDYTNSSYYQFTVFASDHGTPKLTSNVSLIIRVQDVQNQPPFFTGIPYRGSIDEEVTKDTSVITVNARDGDTGISNPVNYTIEEGQCSEYFNVNKDNGEIRTSKQRLDRDSGSLRRLDGVCVFTVLVTEVDSQERQFGNTTATTNVTITVNDRNDNYPSFENQTYAAHIEENAQRNVPIQLDDPQEIKVTDLDQDNNAVINISLRWQNNDTRCDDFKVSPDVVRGTGSLIIQVENSNILDFEKNRELQLLIVAVERFNASHIATATVTLTLTDENDNTPQFNKNRYEFYIPEEPPNGTFVGQISATDVDSGSYGNVTYTLLGSEDKFTIHSQTGNITTVCNSSELDRETIGVYYLTVTATDDGGQGRSNSTSVKITLQDINDNTPVFSRDKYQVFVKENDEDLTRQALVIQAQDRDEINTNNSRIEYLLDSESDSWISSNITVNTTGEIYFQHPIDFEKLPDQDSGVFTFIVYATDFGEPARTGNATVEVTVEDLNDNSPIFDQSQYYGEVQENATSSVNSLHVVLRVNATDLDGSERNSRVQYFIQDGALNRFAINSQTGEIFVQRNAELDRETDSLYNITILAIDLGNNPLNGTTTVIINVTDVNDQPPRFNASTCMTAELLENKDKDKFVTVCDAVDLDTDHDLNYKITDVKATDENGHGVNSSLVQDFFEINPTNGSITVKTTLDRETAEIIELTLQVEDVLAELNAPQTDTKTLTIKLLDVNDNDPEFESQNYTMSVSENALDNTRLGEVYATDADENRTITYSINPGNVPTNSFRIGNKTGIIFKSGPVDREKNSTVLLEVTAIDNGVPTRNTTTDVLITVIDFNDNSPVFYPNSTNYSTEINESTANGTEVAGLMAYDLDDGPNSNISFSMESGGGGHFVIGKEDGRVRTSAILDREQLPVYTITITARDNPIDPTEQRINRTTLTVRLIDENDNAPNFTHDVYSATVSEIASTKAIIHTVTAVDRDSGQNGVVAYSLLNDTEPPGLFAINEDSGQIYVNSSLQTHVGSYILQLMAEDRGSPSLNSTALINITVTDFNIHNPVIGNLPENGTIRVYECVKSGTEIYKFNYTDKDRGENAKAHFNITSVDNDNVLNMFYITDTGSLKVKGELNANLVVLYKFQIQATDKGLPPLSSEKYSLTIRVIDVNNFLPSFQDSFNELSVKENSPNRTFVGTVTATDEDRDSLTCYNISNSLNYTLFDIDETSGGITTKRMFDRETDGDELKIIVMAWDCTTSSNPCDNDTIDHGQNYKPNITVHIKVVDVDDNPPVFIDDEISVGMRRNEEVGFTLDLDLKRGGYVKDNDTDRFGSQSWVFGNNGTATVSADLAAKVTPGTGTNDCAVKGVKNLFCITGNGTVVNNKFFSEDMSGFILLPVSVRDGAGADQAVLKVYLISDSQVLVMTIFDTKQRVATYSDVLLEIYGNITKYTFVYDRLQDHKTPSGTIDTSRSDLYFHVVDPKTQRVLPSEEAQRLVDSFYDLLRDARDRYKVLQVLASTAVQQTDEDDPMRTVYILTAVVVLLALTVAIIVYVSFTLRSRYKRKIKALTVDKTAIAKEESIAVIPGSNQYSKMSNPLLNAKLEEIAHYDNISLSSNNSIDMNDVDNARDDTSYDKIEIKEKIMDLYTENQTYEETESPLEAALRMHALNKASMEKESGGEAEDDDDELADAENVTIHGFVNETFEMETSDI